jgi:predicted RNase H-like HicB family nuclease
VLYLLRVPGDYGNKKGVIVKARKEFGTMSTVTVFVEYDPETRLYVGIVPGIPGAHSQGASLDELQANMKEVLELCLEENPALRQQLPQFVGLQQIEVA